MKHNDQERSTEEVEQETTEIKEELDIQNRSSKENKKARIRQTKIQIPEPRQCGQLTTAEYDVKELLHTARLSYALKYEQFDDGRHTDYLR